MTPENVPKEAIPGVLIYSEGKDPGDK